MIKKALTKTEGIPATAEALSQNSNNETTQQFERVRTEIEQWRKEDLARSGLTDDDIATAIVMPKGGKHPHNGGYDILFRNPATGEEMRGLTGKSYRRIRYRPPVPKDKDGKDQRYGTPFGTGNHCYIPAHTHVALIGDPASPLYLTEGEKKAAKADKSGFPVIGLTGIWNWLDSAPNRKTEKGSNYAIHPDITRYLTTPRKVFMIYDSDATENTRKQRDFATNTTRLAYELEKLGCALFRVDLPMCGNGLKTGLDDYLQQHSVSELKQFIESHAAPVPVNDLFDEKLDDPFADITEAEGKPFLVKYTKSGQISGITFNQSWNARFVARNYNILLEPAENSFYEYNPDCGLWQLVSEDLLRTRLSTDLAAYWRVFYPELVADLLPHRGDRMLRESLHQTRGGTEQKGVFQRDPGRHIIHLRNGMLHLDEMELWPFGKEYYSRNMIPFEFDENAECPRFLNDLMYAALPEDDVDLLQRWAGTVLMGGNPTQQFMLIEGTAGGGKGTFSEIIETMVGHENVCELRTNLLTERFEFAAFVGKSLLCGKDVPGEFLQVRGAESIKKLVGHDSLQAEYKRSNQRGSILGDFGMLITSNDRLKLRLSGDADAWRRRMMLVRYERPPVRKRVPGLARQLVRKEGQGILTWMVAGAVKAVKDIETQGYLILNRRQQQMADTVIFESDGLRVFVQECLERRKGWDVTTEELKSAYVRFCEKNGWSANSGRHVERQLPDLILSEYNVHKSNSLKRDEHCARGFRNLSLRESAL